MSRQIIRLEKPSAHPHTAVELPAVPPGYTRTEAGIIPIDWKLWPVHHMGEVLTGKALAVNGPGKQRPYLRTRNVFDGHIDIEDVLTMPMTDAQFEHFKLRSGDVLLNEGQSLELVGRCAIYRDEYPEACAIQNQLLRFRARRGVCADFAAHLFRYCQKIGVFARVALQTTSIAHLGGSRFERLSLPWPETEDEQRAIAEALSDVDGLIVALEKLIAKKQAIKQAAMQQLLTGKSRLPSFTSAWETKQIANIATPSTEKNSGGDYLPVLTCSKHFGFVDSLTFFKNQVFSRDLSGYKVIRRGQIGYPSNHVEEGSIGFQDCYDVAIVSPIYVVFSVDDSVDSFFVHRLLKLDRYRQEFASATSSSVDRRGSLRWPEFSRISVCLPPIDEQKAIATVLSDMDTEIEALDRRLDKIRQIKDGMMQQLLTGRIRLVKPQVSAVQADAKSKESKPHSWAFNEAIVISTLAKHFGKDAFPLGRKRYTKLSYLLHRHVEKQAEGYLKKAAGPYNPKTKYGGPERIALESGYVREHKHGPYSGFVAADNIAQAEGYFEKWYGKSAIQWLEQFRFRKNDDLELLATVDMAVEELRAAGKNIDVPGVKAVIRSHPEWKAKLDREVFSDTNIQRAIHAAGKLFAEQG